MRPLRHFVLATLAVLAVPAWAEHPAPAHAATSKPAAPTTSGTAPQAAAPSLAEPAPQSEELKAPIAIDWRLVAAGAALLIGALVLIVRQRRQRLLVVDLMLDDLHEGRFAVALSPEKKDSVLGEIQLRLQEAPVTQLESGLASLPREIVRRLGPATDAVRVTTSFKVRGGERLRVMCFGRTAARGQVSLQVGGALAVSSPEAIRFHAQERMVQIVDTDLTVTFDLRTTKSPSRPPRPLDQSSSPRLPPSTSLSASRPASRGTAAAESRPGTSIGSPSGEGTNPEAQLGSTNSSNATGGAAAPAAALPSAAELAKQARALFLDGKYEAAAELYGQLEDLENQARCFLFLGQTERVAQIDAKLAYQRHDLESAVNHYLRAKEPANAARVLRELGRSKEAFRVEAQATAAAGRAEEAAQLYVQADDLATAAELYQEMGNTVRAAELFVRAGAFGEAARLYAAQGEFPRAAELFEQAQLPAEASLVLYKMGSRDRALGLAEQVGAEHPKFLAAATVRVRAYAELGRAAELATLARSVAAPQAVVGDPDLLYTLAAFFDSKGLAAEALGTLHRVAQVDAQFKDLPARIARLEAALRGRSPSGSAVTFVRAAVGAGGETMADARDASETSLDLEPATSAPKPAATGLPAGTQRYRIEAELGRGAMGIVYRGTDTLLGRPVAVKTLPKSLASDPRLSRMFLDEARSLAALNHPHIVQIYDMGEMEGTLFLAMEFVTGETLETVLEREGKLSVRRALEVVDQVAQALESAHAHGVVHRDIKPANVMLGQGGRIKLMDFGIAAAGEGAQQLGERLGTPYYMSPEQALGKPVDGRSDLYALGVVLYRLVSATLPFDSGDILAAHVSTPPPPLGARAPEVPAGLDALISKLLAKDPAHRPASATELRAQFAGLTPSAGT